jgi:transcriptional regulator with XRE-family HTH domain
VRGISQTVLADRAAISRINLSRIENGKAEAGLRTIANLARAMDMKMAELLDGID